MKYLYLVLFTILIAPSQVFSQAEEAVETIIPLGTTHTIFSKILDQDRPLNISLPTSYGEKTDKYYPVVYLLDGGLGNFHHTTASVNFLARMNQIPEMIVVGIPNTDDRTRDLTPPTKTGKEQFPSAGGADDMLKFISTELFDHISKKFRITDYKMLIGHSFGGLFAAHTLLHHPGIFDSYIAISPSLWWDEQDLVLNQTKEFFDTQDKLAGHFYMTMGSESGTMVGGAWKFQALLEEQGPEKLKWAFNRMEDEDHGSIPLRSTYHGLKFIFSDFDLNANMDAFKAGTLSLADYEANVKTMYNESPNWERGRLLYIGEQLFNNFSPAVALPFFRKAAELFPEHVKPWLQQGESLQQMGKTTEAIASFQKALELDPTNLPAKVSLKKLGVDVGEIETMKLTDKELKTYAGKYKLSLGFTMTLELADGELWVNAPETAREALAPLEKDVFYLSSKEARITFERSEKGEITGMMVVTPGPTFTGKKI